jgi:L-fucose isomerase-like protein
MKRATQPVTVGLIVGNRGFFPAHLAESGRKTMLQVLEAQGFRVIALSPEETLYGSVVSHADSHKCADLFKRHRDEIDGVIVTLPNFGEERAIADTLRWAGLDVPVLIQAFPDDPARMTVADRRDSFCGKMSACNNLRQYGIRYSLTRLHTVDPESAAFRQDLERFAGICRIVRGFKNARIGVIGARPTAFNTVRFSEKLLERSGISVETLDLSEVLGRIDRLDSAASSVKGKLEQIGGYIQTAGVPAASLLRMAKFGVVVDE